MVQLGRLFVLFGKRHRGVNIQPKMFLPKHAHDEIWGRSVIMVALKESFSGKKTVRQWKPNIFYKNVYSEILEETLRLKFSTSVIREMDFMGGFDNYILKIPEKELKTRKAVELREYLTAVKEKKEEGVLSLEEIKEELKPKPKPNRRAHVPKDYNHRFYFDLRGPRKHMIYC